MKANYTKNNSPGNNEPYSVSELSYSLKQLVEDNYQQDKKKVWDKSVANAMANANLEMTIKKNS